MGKIRDYLRDVFEGAGVYATPMPYPGFFSTMYILERADEMKAAQGERPAPVIGKNVLVVSKDEHANCGDIPYIPQLHKKTDGYDLFI